MNGITLFGKRFVPYISQAELKQDIDRLAGRMNADFAGSQDIPILLCVLNGSILFTGELMKRLEFDMELMTIKLSSYQGTSSTGSIREITGISGDVSGRRVIIVEDIVDTGNTILYLRNKLIEEGASDIRICTMLLKPEVYHQDLKLDYVAREIPDKFVLGFGLDFNELGRNLNELYVLDE